MIRACTIPREWEAEHAMDVAVAMLGEGGAVTPARERLVFWPFTPATLDADLRAVGFVPESSTFAPDADRYAVTARHM